MLEKVFNRFIFIRIFLLFRNEKNIVLKYVDRLLLKHFYIFSLQTKNQMGLITCFSFDISKKVDVDTYTNLYTGI